MDMRTGDLYQSREEALAAGVPEQFVVEVDHAGEVVTVTAGPFKGRTYRRTSSGLQRLDRKPRRSR